MTQSATFSAEQDITQRDWQSELQEQAYAYGKPDIVAQIKQSPGHFIVTEIMDIEPKGEGEHFWLDITKTRVNTDAVAKSLARFSDVAYRDVGYSGMKDFNAITRQWFSVWKPKGADLDWSLYDFERVEINQVVKHSRKIRRGTHRANRFHIRVVGLAESDAVQKLLSTKLEHISNSGVPNYFGAQRFGRSVSNLPQALDMFSGKKRVKDRKLRSILLSSARSWLFNQVASARIQAGTWQTLYIGEPANLNGSNSVFLVTDIQAETKRLANLDIHPTAPLWGEKSKLDENRLGVEMDHGLFQLEQTALSAYKPLQEGLEKARIEYQRRAIRLVPKDLKWTFEQGDLCLSFELQRGQFATSLLRELVCEV